jgi:hypothetical protein
MPFICPACHRLKTLRITDRIELSPDARSDEITLQLIKCSQCGFCGVAVYEESRRGALDSESWHHTGYGLAQDQIDQIRKAISRCPDSSNSRCQCASHRSLGKKDPEGIWDGLSNLDLEDPFPLQYSR